jgi:acetolactate synthase I/II/III large subunit
MKPQEVIEELNRQATALGSKWQRESIVFISLLTCGLTFTLASLEENVIVTTGVGQHQMWACQHYRWRNPRSWGECALNHSIKNDRVD